MGVSMIARGAQRPGGLPLVSTGRPYGSVHKCNAFSAAEQRAFSGQNDSALHGGIVCS